MSQEISKKLDIEAFWRRLEQSREDIPRLGPYARIFLPLSRSYRVVENLKASGNEEAARLYSLAVVITAVLMDGWVAHDAIGLTVGPYEARQKLQKLEIEDAVLAWLLFLQHAGYAPNAVYEGGRGTYQIVWRGEALERLINDIARYYTPLLTTIKEILEGHNLTHGHIYKKVVFLLNMSSPTESVSGELKQPSRYRGRENPKIKIGDVAITLVIRKDKVELYFQTHKLEEFLKAKDALKKAGLIPGEDFGYTEQGAKYDIFIRSNGWLKIRIEAEKGNPYAKEAYDQLLKYAEQLGGPQGEYIRKKLAIGTEISALEKKKLPFTIKVGDHTVEVRRLKAAIIGDEEPCKKNCKLQILIEAAVDGEPKQYELTFRWAPTKAYKGKQYYQREGACYDKILREIVEALTGRKVPSSGNLSGVFLDRLKQYDEIRKEIEEWEKTKPE